MRAYGLLQVFSERLASWRVVPWTEPCETPLASLTSLKLGIGTMDLRIASIALTSNATLLSRNLRDFQKVPNLCVEDWLHDPQD